MKKLTRLLSLPTALKLEILNYLLCRLFGMTLSKAQKQIYTLFCDLDRYDGKVISYNKERITIQFRNKAVTVTLRNYPSSDYRVFTQVFKEEQYASTAETFRKYFGNQASYILDCGGNIGLTSLYLNTLFPGCSIAVVEPDANNLSFVENNFKNNHLADAFLFKKGIWSDNANLEVINTYGDGNHWALSVRETTAKDALPGVSIPFLLSELKWPYIDILKIDIEGAEFAVFDRQKSDLTFLEKTKVLAIEIHEDVGNKEVILAVLKEFNFEYFNDGELTVAYNQRFIL